MPVSADAEIFCVILQFGLHPAGGGKVAEMRPCFTRRKENLMRTENPIKQNLHGVGCCQRSCPCRMHQCIEPLLVMGDERAGPLIAVGEGPVMPGQDDHRRVKVFHFGKIVKIGAELVDIRIFEIC